jgi:hypothetical protein
VLFVFWNHDARSPTQKPKPNGGGHEAPRLEQEREGAVRSRAWSVGMFIRITFQITRNIRCSNPTLAAISSPVRGDILRTMPLLRSSDFYLGRDSTKMPRLRRCRPQLRRRPRAASLTTVIGRIRRIGRIVE